jgi:hypothetical protein
MASHFIGLNRGQSGLTNSDFTIGASTGSTDVEVRIDDGKSLNEIDVVNILMAIVHRIQRDSLTTVLTAARL